MCKTHIVHLSVEVNICNEWIKCWLHQTLICLYFSIEGCKSFKIFCMWDEYAFSALKKRRHYHFYHHHLMSSVFCL